MNCGKRIFIEGSETILLMGWFLNVSGALPVSIDEAINNFYSNLLDKTAFALSIKDCSTIDEISLFETNKETLANAVENIFNEFKNSKRYGSRLQKGNIDLSGNSKELFLDKLTISESITEDTDISYLDIDGSNIEDDISRKSLSEISEILFNGNEPAQLYWENKFNQEISLKIIIDPENDIYVDNKEVLNKQILQYKEDQYQKLKNYLENTLGYKNKLPDKLYQILRNGVVLVNNYQKALLSFYNYILKLLNENKLSNMINKSWNDHMFGKVYEPDFKFMEAVMAFINLKYFDQLVKTTLGDIISIDDNLTEPLVKDSGEEELQYKYGFGKSKSKITGWSSMKDVRDAIDETSGFSKMLISSIPMLDYRSGAKDNLGRNINLVQFTVAFTNLFDAINKLNIASASNIKIITIKDAADTFHSDPEGQIKIILSTIFDRNNIELIDKLKETESLNDFDLNVLRSVYERVYNTGKGIKSFSRTEIQYFRQHNHYGAFPVTSSITRIIDSTMAMNYLETVVDKSTENEITVTRIKRKFPNAKTVFDMIETINTNMLNTVNREAIQSEYKVSKTDDNNWTVNIGNKIYNFNCSSNGSTNSFGILTKTDQSKIVVSDLTPFLSIKLEDPTVRLNLMKNILNETDKAFMNLLEFIDSMLLTNFASDSGLLLLSIYKLLYKGKNNSNDAWLRELVISAMQGAVINKLYYDYSLMKDENGDSLSIAKFQENLGSEQFEMPYLSKLGLDNNRRTFKKMFEQTITGNQLKVVYFGQTWLDVLADAMTIISGEVSKATTKNSDNNSLANYSPAFLGAQIKYELKKQIIGGEIALKENTSAPASSYLLFANEKNKNAIISTVEDTEIVLADGTSKLVKKMTLAELLRHAIVDKFIRTQFNKDGKLSNNRRLIIQPTTYSDKTKFVNYMIESIINGTNGKAIDLMTVDYDTLEQLYIDTIGQAYKATYNSVLSDYNKIFGTTDLFEINRKFREISKLAKIKSIETGRNISAEDYFTEMAQSVGVTVYRDTHYRRVKGTLTLNELLIEYATDLYSDKSKLHQRLQQEKLNFLNVLLQTRVSFDDESQVIELLKEQINKLNIGLNYGDKNYQQLEDWISGNKLVLAKVNGKNYVYGKSLPDGTNIQLNPLLERYFMISLVAGNNLRMSLSGSEINHKVKGVEKGVFNEKVIEGLSKITINEDETYSIKVSELLNETLNITGEKLSDLSITEIKQLLNKLIEEASLAGDYKSVEKLIDGLNVVNLQLYKIESAAQMAQLKRNVIIPATMQYYLQGRIDGIASTMRCAIIDDTQAKIFNFDGESTSEDAHDGSAVLGLFTSILENNSLQDLAVGEIKKPIWHHYDQEHGCATLVKYAADTMTCKWMRQTHLSTHSLWDLHKKMTNLRWSDPKSWNGKPLIEIDLINGNDTNKLGGKINFQTDILNGNELFYEDPETGINYKIVDFGIENGIYFTKEIACTNTGDVFTESKTYKVYHIYDAESNHIPVRLDLNSTYEISENDKLNGIHTIDSVFELHEAMGGIFSKSLVDEESGKELIESESSAYAVVQFMNSVNIYKGGFNEDGSKVKEDYENFTQQSYYQPLKELVIDYLINNSAIKNGAGNINQSDVLQRGNNIPLRYITLSTDGYGIQMDADHEADEAIMTEFSQVISSLDAGGRIHDYVFPIYEVLGAITLEECEIEMEAIQSLLDTGNATDLYDTIGRMIMRDIKNNAKSNKSGLTDKIIQEIATKFNLNIDHKDDTYKIPFSDANIYGTIMTTFVSLINGKAIKKKYPGSGTVMAPGYNMSQIFKIKGEPYMFEDLLKSVKILQKDNPIKRNPGESITSYYRRIVEEYLKTKQEEEEILENTDSFSPTDIIEIGQYVEDGNINWYSPINLDDIYTYYKFKENPLLYTITNLNNIIIGETYDKPWKDDPSKTNKAFMLKLAEDPERGFEIVKDIESGYWSIHFKTLKENEIYTPEILSEEQKQRLFAAASAAIPEGEKLSTWGELTQGGIAGLNRFANLGFTQIGERNALTKRGESITIPIFLKNKVQLAFRLNITLARNLAPVKIRFEYEIAPGVMKLMNIFDHHLIKKAFYNKEAKLNKNTRQKVFDDLAKGIYIDENGNSYKATIIENSDAELIVSNMFLSKFGISVNLSLSDIRRKMIEKKGLGKSVLKILNADNFDLAFTKNNKQHTYITLNDVLLKQDNFDSEISWRIDEYKRSEFLYSEDVPKEKRIILNSIYALDKDGRKLYEIGREIKTSGLFFNEEDKVCKIDNDGNKIILDKSQQSKYIKGKNGEVIERIFFIKKYTIHQKQGKEYLIHIDKNALEKCFFVKENLSDEELNGLTKEQYRENEMNKFIGRSLLGKIYCSDKFTGIQLNKNGISEIVGKSMPGILTGLLAKLSYDKDMQKLLEEYIKLSKGKVIDGKILFNELKLRHCIGNYASSKNIARQSSFEKSLEFIASRIPAQTLQSFMKMKCVGFSGVEKNVCYVSHWQTWLQGSDYDIDKAYIMGHNFDENGLYIGWSNLFDYSSIKTLKASEYLPIPKHLHYNVSKLGLDITTISKSLIDIESQIKIYQDNISNLKKEISNLKLDNFENEQLLGALKKSLSQLIAIEENKIKNLSEDRVKEYIKVLNYIYKNAPKGFNKLGDNKQFGLNIIGDESVISIIINNLNNHEYTDIPKHLRQGALRNFISSHIEGVISDIRNLPNAYTPISMNDLSDAAEQSPKGDAASRMTLMNPAVVYQMQYQNMVGKNVIGIAAVGEKGSFMLHLYYNELVRTPYSENFKRKLYNSKIEFETTRIIGRANIPVKHADESNEDFALRLILYQEQLNTIKLIQALPDINFEGVENPIILDAIKNYLKGKISADLMISQILSAATDNAKELILGKINAGEKLAKIYLYLITMGFDIKDIVSFMTSDTISAIDELCEENIYDKLTFSINDAISIVKGNISNGILKKIKSLLYFTNLDGKIIRYDYENIAFSDDNIRNMLTGNRDKIIIPNNLDQIKIFNILNNIVDSIRSKTDGIDFKDRIVQTDIKVFEDVLSRANEFSTFGGILGANQGLGTSKKDFEQLIKKLERGISERENILKITSDNTDKLKELIINKILKEDYYNYLNKESYLELYQSEIDEKVNLILNKFIESGIIGNFDGKKWLKDEEYKLLTSDYYNYIKATFNIFEIIPSLPHFKSIFEIAKDVLIMDETMTVKSKLYDRMNLELKRLGIIPDSNNFKNMSSLMLNWCDTILTTSFFKSYRDIYGNPLLFPIMKGWKFLNRDGIEIEANENGIIDLSTPEGLASFKYIMENYIIPQLKGNQIFKNGKLEPIDSKSNDFIQGLSLKSEKGISFYRLNIDMNNYNKNNVSLAQFNKYLKGLEIIATNEKFKYGDRQLSDWFMLYNLYVNKNNYGSDRMTKIFQEFISTKGSKQNILNEYFRTIAEIDYDQSSIDNFKFAIKDFLIEIAPLVEEGTNLNNIKYPYVKIRRKDSGLIDIVNSKKPSESFPIYPPKQGLNEAQMIQRMFNYLSYFLSGQNIYDLLDEIYKVLKVIPNDDEGNIEIFLETLRSEYIKGLIKLEKNC